MAMYYPYLRGKQFELKALREFAQEVPYSKYICPIIEPVKTSFNTLITAIKDMNCSHITFALVLNPSEGDFANDDVDVFENVQEELDEADWIPALIYKRNTKTLDNIIATKGLDNVCVIFKDGVDFEQDKELETFLNNNNITTAIISNADKRASMRKLQSLGKAIIRLDENFHEQKRNVDYINIPEEQFTEEPFYFKEDHFSGFSDYTTLPKTFVDGGMLPYAIAIHFTFKPQQKMVYIRHFVSDSNLSQSNIQGKFAEAGRKALAFFYDHPDYFRSSAIFELENYISDGKYPGLGVLKKISIKHHLLLISNILGEL